MCNMDCFNCEFDDCINDRLEVEDFKNSIDEVPKEIKRKREIANKYASNNREKNRIYALNYYYQHKEEQNQRSREYAKENKERVAANKRAKYTSNIEFYRQKQREYRAKKKIG